MKSAITVLRGRHADGLRGNLRAVIVLRALFCGVALIIPTLVVFWQSAGLSMADIMLLEAICAWSMAIGEVPSGYFADRVGRKISIMCGSAMCCLSLCSYVVFREFSGFAFAEILFGLGFSMISGADEALLVDSLKELGSRGERFGRLWGLASNIEIKASALGFVLGGLLSMIDARLPFLLGASVFGMQFLVALRLVEPIRSDDTRARRGLWGNIVHLARIARVTTIENSATRGIFLRSALVLSALQISFWLYQPYFVVCGIPVWCNGVLLAGLACFGAFTSKRAHKIESGRGIHYWTPMLLLMIGVSLILMGGIVFLLSPLLIIMQQLVRGFYKTMFSAYLHRELDSETRATQASLRNMIDKTIYGVLLVPAGWLVDSKGLLGGYVSLGLIMIVVAVLLGLMNRKRLILSPGRI